MDTLSVSEAQEKLEHLIGLAAKDHRHFRISSDEGSVVLLPEETYDNLLVTLELLSTPALMERIRER
jgi:antitoxin YefM